MPSDLFRRALSSLSASDQLAFESWEDWARTHTGRSADEPTDGAQIVENVRSESHLVGDEDFGHSAALSLFLRECATRATGATDADQKHQAYVEACRDFAGQGLRIPAGHLPDLLLRYVDSETLAEDLVERMLGKRARTEFALRTMATELASARLHDHWDSSRLEAADRLGRGNKVFATCEHSGGAPRDDATALSQALSLRCWQWHGRGPDILVELTYPSTEVDDPRFPTVANAEWIHLFRPAPETLPDASHPGTCSGWTSPLGGHPPQPELVHDNASIAVLARPPRLLKGN